VSTYVFVVVRVKGKVLMDRVRVRSLGVLGLGIFENIQLRVRVRILRILNDIVRARVLGVIKFQFEDPRDPQ